jgi:hypothetical protein
MAAADRHADELEVWSYAADLAVHVADRLLAGDRLARRFDVDDAADVRERLTNEIDDLHDRLRTIWMARYQPAGWPAVAARFEALRTFYDNGFTDEAQRVDG